MVRAVPDKNATVIALLVAVAFSAIAVLSAPFIEYGEALLQVGLRVGRQLALAILPWIAVWAAWSRRYSVLSAVWVGAGLMFFTIDPSYWLFTAVGGGLVVLAIGVLLRSRSRGATKQASFR